MKKYIALIILAIAVSCFAVNEIQFTGTVNSEYCIRIMDANNVYDFTNDNWNIASSTDPNGFLDATESSLTPGYYLADMPSVSSGTYHILTYDSSAATVDATTDFDGGFAFNWDGSSEVTDDMLATPADVDDSIDSKFTFTGETVQADMVRINGELTSENNATLSLKQLDITNDTSSAVVLDSPQWGLSIIGGGGVDIEGTSAAGLQITGATDDISVDNDGDSYDLADYLETIYSKLPSGNFFDVLNNQVLLPYTTEAQIDNIEADTNELQIEYFDPETDTVEVGNLADINAEVDTALEDYNSPTYQEVADINDVLRGEINAIPTKPSAPSF